MQVARHAIADAREICIRQYGSAPDVDIYGVLDFTFAYVPEHLHHMVFELVKNSLRAGMRASQLPHHGILRARGCSQPSQFSSQPP